jgi:hypothetical protein
MSKHTKWIVIAVAALALTASLILLGPQVSRLLAPVPTPPCSEPTLTLGATQFVVKPIARAADGSVAVPQDTPHVAYQVEGTQPNVVLVLSPAASNAALKDAIKGGDQATLVQANCNSSTFSVSAPQPAPSNVATLLTQPTAGLVIVVQASPSAAGYFVTGELSEEIIKAFDTPQPGPSNRLAEVSLLETSTSADQSTLRVSVSILNSGPTPFTLAASDVSLTSENASPITPASAEPSLPHDCQPGKAETIYLTFPRPSSSTAVIKVLDVEFDLENF